MDAQRVNRNIIDRSSRKVWTAGGGLEEEEEFIVADTAPCRRNSEPAIGKWKDAGGRSVCVCMCVNINDL